MKRSKRDSLRKHLVHAAGCTERNCVFVASADILAYQARLRGVRIPRSLRRADFALADEEKAIVRSYVVDDGFVCAQ